MCFGGAFLGMVGLKYFFDADKEVDWIAAIERPLAKVGNIEAISIGFELLMTYLTSTMLSDSDSLTFLVAAIAGLLNFRSEERRVGNGCVSTCSYRWWPSHNKKKYQYSTIHQKTYD